MSRRRAERQAVAGRCAAAARELGLPVPFELGELGTRLERRRRNPVRLVPRDLARTASSGLLCRTAAADYLYYEQETSPFHQAHIVLTLAARLLLSDDEGVSIAHPLVSEVGPELVRLMLGPTAQAPVTDVEAEAFAFLVLGRASRQAAHQAPAARRQLLPLWAVLHEAVPEIGGASSGRMKLRRTFQLYRTVIDIRDMALALRPYRDPGVAAAAGIEGCVAGLAGDDLAASVEATVLADAAHARKNGQPARHEVCPSAAPLWLRADMSTEAAWLVKVSRAFVASSLVRGRPPDGPPGRSAQPGRATRQRSR